MAIKCEPPLLARQCELSPQAHRNHICDPNNQQQVPHNSNFSASNRLPELSDRHDMKAARCVSERIHE